MDKRYIVGIDIGQANIHGTIGKADKEGKLKILSSCFVKSSGMKKGDIIGIEALSDAIKSCVAEMEKAVNIYIDEIYVGIPTGRCRFISSTGAAAITNDESEVLQGDVKRVLKNAADVKLSMCEKIVDIIPITYRIDSKDNIKNPVGMKGNKLEADVKIGVSDDVYLNDIYKAVERCGIKILKTVVQSEATSSFMLNEGDMSQTIGLVDVGAASTNIAIYKNGCLDKASIIPLGGDCITSDIAYCTKIPLTDCENIKLKIHELMNHREPIEFTDKYEHKTELDIRMIYDVVYARSEEILKFILNALKELACYDELDNVILYGGGISNFDFIEDIWKTMSNKSLFIVNSKTVNLENTLIINTLGIVKYMYNEVKLNSKDITLENSVSDNKDINENRNSKISRIKKFFREYF